MGPDQGDNVSGTMNDGAYLGMFPRPGGTQDNIDGWYHDNQPGVAEFPDDFDDTEAGVGPSRPN